MFKAWNQETRLMMRLNSIECARGALFRKDHILLQFTGLYDKQDEEIYEMDMLLIAGRKFVVSWDTDQSGWGVYAFPDGQISPFVKRISKTAVRICSYFESEEAA